MPDRRDGRPTGPAATVATLLARGDGLVWIDLDHTDRPGMARLGTLVAVQPPDVLDCHTRTPVPRIHLYSGHLFSAINGVDGRLHFQPLKVFLNSGLVVTVLGPTHEALAREAAHRKLTVVRGRLDNGTLCPVAGLCLVTAIRFEMLRGQEELTGVVAHRIAELKRTVVRTDPVTAESLLQDLVELRHDVQTIRTSAAQTNESYGELIRTLRSERGLMPVDSAGYGEMVASSRPASTWS
jgi:Mg2+ and Co2+ transporter CorA